MKIFARQYNDKNSEFNCIDSKSDTMKQRIWELKGKKVSGMQHTDTKTQRKETKWHSDKARRSNMVN